MMTETVPIDRDGHRLCVSERSSSWYESRLCHDSCKKIMWNGVGQGTGGDLRRPRWERH